MVVVVLVVVVVVEVMPMDDRIEVPLSPRIKPGEMDGIAPTIAKIHFIHH